MRHNIVLVIGQPGTGKTAAIRTLEPAKTFLVNVLEKPLPFRIKKADYTKISKSNPQGNMFASADWNELIRCIKNVSDNMPNIENLIIDDWQYLMSSEYIRRHKERGFDKYTEIQVQAWSTIQACVQTRKNLNCFILTHSEVGPDGTHKIQTLGKMLDEKMKLDGLFIHILHARFIDGQYMLQTKMDGPYLARSPMEMWQDTYIPNDLKLVAETVKNYSEFL